MKVNNYIYTDSETIKNNEDILNTNENTGYYEISLKDDNSLLILKKVDERTEENIPDNNFNISFYNKLKEYFNPLEIILEDKKFYVVNKDVFLKKLNEKTFDYFRKYPAKIETINKILFAMKESLKYENLEQEMEETSIFPYLFKIDEIKDIGNKTIESKTPEIYSGYNVPTLKTYITKKVHRKKIKINFEEKLDESKSSPEQIKSRFKQILELPETEPFEFDFFIKGYYIYNTETETVEKIEVDKEIKFYINTRYSSAHKCGTFHPYILKLWGKEVSKKENLDIFDINFYMTCLQQDVIELDVIISYINVKLELTDENYTNEQMFRHLLTILDTLGTERKKTEKKRIIPRKIIVE